MPGRVVRRNPELAFWNRIRDSQKAKFLRKLAEKSILWLGRRREKRKAIMLCAQLQLPPEAVKKLLAGKKFGHEVIQELQQLVEMADNAGLNAHQRRTLFKNARTIEHARAVLQQMSQPQGQMQAAA